MKTNTLWAPFAAVALCLGGCSNSESTTPAAPADACQAHVQGTDFEIDDDLGAAGDPANWPQQVPATAVVSTTYLRLKDDEASVDVFRDLINAITAQLSGSPGLLGVSLAKSKSCSVNRTLTLWETEAAMMDFVMGEAHLNAVQRVGEVSRGGSITDHWPASDFDPIHWETIVPALANHDGPVY